MEDLERYSPLAELLAASPSEARAKMQEALADINVIDHANLTLHKPHMIHDLPAGGRRLVQDADGYLATVKAGEIVVEHDEDTMRASDHVVDFGPGPGIKGGDVVAEGQTLLARAPRACALAARKDALELRHQRVRRDVEAILLWVLAQAMMMTKAWKDD